MLLAVCCLGMAALGAQMRIVPLDEEQGYVALGLALRHLGNTGIFMQATAHPDDENNGLLVMMNRGLGYRTALATATRGNGGQNEIGPELFEALGVLRTEELAAMHRFDGAEQYFTRAVDFGYSFSVDETIQKWGRDEIVGDFVRLIRTVRPDVMLSLHPEGDGGGQHHQASALLAREAYGAAGDPTRFPEHLKAGLRPWQPKKFYAPAGRGSGAGGTQTAPTGSRSLTVNLAAYDPLLGKTYAEIGSEARSMHKCQGMAQLLSLPGPATSTFQLLDTTITGQTQRDERSVFDGIDTTLVGLAQFVGPKPPRELTSALSAVAAAVDLAQRKFDTEGVSATVQPLLTGLRGVRAARAQVRALAVDELARFDIEFRLRQKEREFQQAILLAGRIRVEALADDGVVTPGQPLKLTVIVANRGASDASVKQVRIDGFDGNPSCTLMETLAPTGRGGRGRGQSAAPPTGGALSSLRRDQVAQCSPEVRVPANTPVSEPYWQREGEAGRYTFDDDAPFGLPYRPTPFYVQVILGFAGAATEEVIGGFPVQYRYGDIVSGEKRSELLIVPPISVRVSPEIAIMPAAPPPPPPPPPPPTTGAGRPGAKPAPRKPAATAKPAPARPANPRAAQSAAPPEVAPPPPPERGRDIRVTLVNDTKGEAESTVKLTLPEDWTATPPEHAVAFSREGESQTVRFLVRPPVGAQTGTYAVGAVATFGGQQFTRGYQVIEYPHIRRQHIYETATTKAAVLEVRTKPDVTVGYIMGVGDEVPQAIGQLGVPVTMLTAEDLAWGDLARFHTIVTGVRAYERRADLRAHNSRLLDYVRDGGTLIVQYNKTEFNEAQYGPWAAIVTQNRVTDERAPISIIARGHPLFTTPNELNDSVWNGWVQERGLYFLGDMDSRYRDLVRLEDSFPNNAGEKTGALVDAQYGKGHWVYVGLGLWRELPAGVAGAYQLLANLISLK
jgi:LmbE family N-acetylglucosaminyl deacetylase